MAAKTKLSRKVTLKVAMNMIMGGQDRPRGMQAGTTYSPQYDIDGKPTVICSSITSASYGEGVGGCLTM